MTHADNPFYGENRADIIISRPVMYKVEQKHGLAESLAEIIKSLTELESISYSKDAVTGHYIVRLEGHVIVLRKDSENGKISVLTAYRAGDEFGGNPL